MGESKEIGGGWRKEIVPEYGHREGGTVVPNAFEDDRGGRPGLTGGTYLEPPVDDPPMDSVERLPPNRIQVQPVKTVQPQAAKIASTELALSTCVSAPPSLSMNAPPLPTTGSTPKETAVAETPHLVEGPVNINALAELLSNPEVLARLHERKASVAPPPAANDGTGEFIEIVMVGSFGRFRSKVADVIICENHVALLYTAETGDDGLAYEPPMDMAFTLKVPYDDASFREYSVQHFGLTTKIKNVGELVVLPKADVPVAESAASEEFEEPVEHG